MIFELFRWWYGAGWLRTMRSIPESIDAIEHRFSVLTLMDTMFQPWRRIITYPGNSFDAKFHAAVDNMVSRFVGFFIRFFVLLTAAIAMIVIFVATTLLAVLWPLVPPLIGYCVFRGVKG